MWAIALHGAIARAAGALALALSLSAPPAAAQGGPPPVPCRFDAAPTSVVFTGYTPWGAGAVATSTIRYDCPPPVTAAWIAISVPRVLSAGAETLAFELYQDAARSSAWPDAPPAPVAPRRNGSVTVHAFLPPQDAAAGAYATTLTVRLYSGTAGNETDTASLPVQLTLPDTCVVNPATLSFGDYDSYGVSAATPLDAQATIQIACTRGTAWSVGLGPGNNPAGALRQMASGANRLAYQLYSDVGRTTVWDGVAVVGGSAASVAPVDLTVHGRVPAGQLPMAGPYQDVVQSTINF